MRTLCHSTLRVLEASRPADPKPTPAPWNEACLHLAVSDDMRELLAAVPELLANPVVITDAELRILWVNAAFERRTGYALNEVKGKVPGTVLYGPLTDSAVVEAMRSRLDRGERIHGVELLKYAKGGEVYWVSIEAFPVHDLEGRLARFISIETDINVRKQAEAALRGSEQRMRALFETSAYAMVVVDALGRIELLNPAAQRLFGYDEPELIGREVQVLLPPAILDRRGLAVEWLRETGLPQVLGQARELLACAKGGREFPVEISVAEFPTPAGARYAATVRDISQRCAMEAEARQLTAQLRASIAALEATHRYSQELAAMSELLHGCNTEEEIQQVSQRYLPVVFADAAGVLLLRGADQALRPSCVWGAPIAAAVCQEDCWALRLVRVYEGDAETGLNCAHSETAGAGGSICVPLVAHDMSLGLLHLSYERAATESGEREQRRSRAIAAAERIGLALANLRLREDLRRQAMRDPLTGLLNRRYMQEAFARELARCERRGLPLAVLMLDIDYFKRFNDEFGHAAGDRVLRLVADALLAAVRREDIVCRFGGEEFLIVLPETSLGAARARAEALRERVAELAPEPGDTWVGPLGVSIGLAMFRDHGHSTDALVRAADAALYAAKRAGRGRVEEAGSAIPE